MFLIMFALIYTNSIADEIVYDGSQVFIYNKNGGEDFRLITNREQCERIFTSINKFPFSLTYKVTKKYCPLYLYDHDLRFEHLWTFEEHPTRTGFFYLRNTASPADKLKYGTPIEGSIGRKNLLGPKITLMGRAKVGNMFVSWDNSYHESNLFKFINVGNGYYYIKSSKFGCVRANPNINAEKCRKAKKYKSAQWKLVPRIKAVQIRAKIIFGPVDNLQGPAFDGPYTVTVQHGVTRTKTAEVRDFQSYKVSLEASVDHALGSAGMGFEFTQEIEKTLTTTEESRWVRTEIRTVTVPARSKYAIVQFAADVEGELDEDSCQILNGNTKIYVTQNSNFYDDDGKIINIREL